VRAPLRKGISDRHVGLRSSPEMALSGDVVDSRYVCVYPVFFLAVYRCLCFFLVLSSRSAFCSVPGMMVPLVLGLQPLSFFLILVRCICFQVWWRSQVRRSVGESNRCAASAGDSFLGVPMIFLCLFCFGVFCTVVNALVIIAVIRLFPCVMCGHVTRRFLCRHGRPRCSCYGAQEVSCRLRFLER
jgi:hypothetical protein